MLLLKYGCDYKSHNTEGLSAFHLGKKRNWVNKSLLIIWKLAAKKGIIEIVQLFLDNGADIHSKTKNKETVADLGSSF